MLTRRGAWWLTALALMAQGGIAMAAAGGACSLFPVRDVRLLPGPFRDAMETDRAYLLRLEPDRLLSHMSRVAGLPAAPSYGGWDSGGAGSVGHYLTAISYMSQATGDRELARRAGCIAGRMAAIQKANGDGGLYSSEWDRGYFERLRRGDVPDVTVAPWYTTHKTMAGLRDAWLLCGDRTARDVLVRMADWSIAVTSRLTPGQWQKMLAAEHGAPHEVLADVFAITGERKYLEAARRFRHDAVFIPLSRGDGSVLDNLHANTQIPKFVAYERIAALDDDGAFHRAAANFWREVVYRRSWVNGGNSQWERFFAADRYPREVNEVCGPETCNTYNMLKLTEALFVRQPSVTAADYYESALYNHILSSQEPERGGFVYYTSMRPGHYRTYSTDFDSFWCCVGTGMENHAKYGGFIYAHRRDRLFVNLFIASELAWKERGLSLRQETAFPDKPSTTLRLALQTPSRFTLAIRCPGWTASAGPRITVNGVPWKGIAKPGTYAAVTRTWKTGDTVRVELPMSVRLATLPGSDAWTAALCGPILLAAPLGKQDLTPDDFRGLSGTTPQLARIARPLRNAPVLVGDLETIARHISRTRSPGMEFVVRGPARPGDLRLIPFFRLHNERYAIYIPRVATSQYASYRERLEAEEREEGGLDARTIDRVRPGEQQSETDHGLASDRSTTGPAQYPCSFWRDARGWFEYQVAVEPGHPVALRCVFWGSDAGRDFDILIDGRVLTSVSLTGERPGEYVVKTYDVSREWLYGKSRITVRFQAAPGSIAGGLFDLRIVRQLP